MEEKLQEELLKVFEERYRKYNEKVLEELGNVIKQFSDLIPKDAYKLAQQLKYNTTYEKLITELSKITGQSIKDIKKIVERIAKENLSLARVYYEAKGLSVPIYQEHKDLQKLVQSISNMASKEFINISRNTGFKLLDVSKKPLLLSVKETYQKVIDEAVYAVITGKDNYNSIMKDIINQLSASGVRKIEYESGYSRRIDTAVRMNIMDTIRQISNKSNKLFGEEFGADGVEIKVHSHPALDHEDIQGHQFSNEEFEKFQNHMDCVDYKGNKFSNLQGKKHRRAISEYNCYHVAFPIVLGVNNPLYSDKELQKIINDNNKLIEIDGKKYTKYEVTQLQRRLETEIRRSKEQQILAKNSDNEDLILKSRQRTTQLKNKYREVCNKVDLKEDTKRQYVPNSSAIEIKKANSLSQSNLEGNSEMIKEFVEKIDMNNINSKIADYNSTIRISNREYAYVIQKNGEVYKFTGDEESVKINDVEFEGAYITHNHLKDKYDDIYKSFGEDDFRFLKSNQNINTLYVTNEEYDCYVKVLKNLDIDYTTARNNGLQLMIDEVGFGDDQHYMFKWLRNEGYVEYERINRKTKERD